MPEKTSSFIPAKERYRKAKEALVIVIALLGLSGCQTPTKENYYTEELKASLKVSDPRWDYHYQLLPIKKGMIATPLDMPRIVVHSNVVERPNLPVDVDTLCDDTKPSSELCYRVVGESFDNFRATFLGKVLGEKNIELYFGYKFDQTTWKKFVVGQEYVVQLLSKKRPDSNEYEYIIKPFDPATAIQPSVQVID